MCLAVWQPDLIPSCNLILSRKHACFGADRILKRLSNRAQARRLKSPKYKDIRWSAVSNLEKTKGNLDMEQPVAKWLSLTLDCPSCLSTYSYPWSTCYTALMMSQSSSYISVMSIVRILIRSIATSNKRHHLLPEHSNSNNPAIEWYAVMW